MSDCAIGSPPYLDEAKRERSKEPWARAHGKDEYGDRDPGRHVDGYGTAPGQLGALAAGAAPAPGGTMTKTLTWEGLYDGSWKSLIVGDAFRHPAKYSRLLIRRIYEHMIARGWVGRGSTVIDPFGGVSLGALDAMTSGINWIGIEVESSFCILSHRNIAHWLQRWGCCCGEACRSYLRVVREASASAAVPKEGGTLFLQQSLPGAVGDGEETAARASRADEGPAGLEQGQASLGGTPGEIEGPHPLEQGQGVAGGGAPENLGATAPGPARDGAERQLGRRAVRQPKRLRRNSRGRKAEAGAPARDGAAPGAAPGVVGAGSPRERRQDGQPDREPAPSHGLDTHEAPPPERGGQEAEAADVSGVREGVHLDTPDLLGRLQERAAEAVREGLRRQAEGETVCPRCRRPVAPVPQILHGDSRDLAALLAAHAGGAVSSPPYATDTVHGGKGVAEEVRARAHAASHTGNHWGTTRGGASSADAYGTAPGQLGALPPGVAPAAGVGSPPYSSEVVNHRPAKDLDARPADTARPRGTLAGGGLSNNGYGAAPGQLGALPPGVAPAAGVGSPPYEDALSDKGNRIDWAKSVNPSHGRQHDEPRYGASADNLGNQSGDTFWSAARQILLQLHSVLRPGAVTAWVTKDFCRKGRRVPFSRQWAALCAECGFELVEWVQASLGKRWKEKTLFDGEVVKERSRKSFFRRLSEKRPGAPRIDEEDVTFFRRSP